LACSKRVAFQGALKSPTGTRGSPSPPPRPSLELSARTRRAASAVELPQSGWFRQIPRRFPRRDVTPSPGPRETFFRLVASSFRSSILRQSASNPEKRNCQRLPLQRSPFSCQLQISFSARSANRSSAAVWWVHPASAPLYRVAGPLYPRFSGHDSNPNGAKAVAGSQYTSFPFQLHQHHVAVQLGNAFIILRFEKNTRCAAKCIRNRPRIPRCPGQGEKTGQLIWRPSP